LIGAEKIGIKSKLVARFPVPRAQSHNLARLPIISTNFRPKLRVGDSDLRVGDVGGLLIAVSEGMIDAPPVQQLALMLIAKNLKACLEPEANGAVKPETKKTDDG
jgi:hypothetical protein